MDEEEESDEDLGDEVRYALALSKIDVLEVEKNALSARVGASSPGYLIWLDCP